MTDEEKTRFKIRRGPLFCWFHKHVFSLEFGKYDDERFCPLCNKGFSPGDPVFMVLCNNKLFPNTLIHQSCMDTDLLITTHALMRSYSIFAKFMEEHKGWS